MNYSSKVAQEKRRAFLDPRTKLALVLALAVFVLGGLGGNALGPLSYILSALPFLLLLQAKKYKGFLRGVVILAAGYGCRFALPYLSGTAGTLALFVGDILTRFVTTIVMGTYLMETTTVSEFIAAATKMHVPDTLTIPLSVMFRFFPTVKEEWLCVRRAMGMRGIHLGGAKGSQILEYQMVPMITGSVLIGEELSAAALTRGLGSDVKRTNICCIGFRLQDVILIGFLFFVILAWMLSLCGVSPW